MDLKELIEKCELTKKQVEINLTYEKGEMTQLSIKVTKPVGF